MQRLALPFVLMPLIVSGCAINPENCDPDEGGFLKSSVGVLSGCYEERNVIQSETVQVEKRKNDQLLKENKALQAETQRKQQQLGAVRRKIESIESQIPVLQKRIADREESEALLQEIKSLRAELLRLEDLEATLTESI